MSKQDYYELLGVARDADGDAIKKAFRKAAMKYHPDKNPGDKAAEQKFKELNEAHDVLKDEQKRAAYDRMGHAAFDAGAGGPRRGGFGFEQGDFVSGFEEIFREFTGGGRQRNTARGQDLRYNLEIGLEEAFRGKQATIRLPSSVACDGSACSAAMRSIKSGGRAGACSSTLRNHL